MEDSYEFDHYDYKGQPWHKSTSITFTITDKGAEITLAKANTEEYLELPKESFALFNKHFGQPEDLPILVTAYTIHKARRGGEVAEVAKRLGKKVFGWISDDALGGVTMNQGDYHSGPAGYSPNTPYPDTQYGSGFDEGDWR